MSHDGQSGRGDQEEGWSRAGGEVEAPRARRGSGPHGGWQAMLAGLAGDLAVATALEYARGRRCLTVVHGDVETCEDQGAVDDLSRDLAEIAVQLGGRPEQLVRVVSGNDFCTWWWAGGDTLEAQRVVDVALGLAWRYDRGWWRCSQEPA